MYIKNAIIHVDMHDSFEHMTLVGCEICCKFNIYKKDYTPPKMFEIHGYFDGKTEDFIGVFKGADMINCRIIGTDNG